LIELPTLVTIGYDLQNFILSHYNTIVKYVANKVNGTCIIFK
jgi:hypothetical protein